MEHFNAARALMQSFAPEPSGAKDDPETLNRRLKRQNLIAQTMLVLMLEKGVFTEDEFRDCAKRLDIMDGVRDGALAEDKTMVDCPACGEPVRKNAVKCTHCGAELEPDLIPRRP